MSHHATQFTVSSPVHALKRQLSQFGLNPQEWQVLPLTTGDYCAIHKKEQDLVLVGNVCFRRPEARWETLELLEDDVVA